MERERKGMARRWARAEDGRRPMEIERKGSETTGKEVWGAGPFRGFWLVAPAGTAPRSFSAMGQREVERQAMQLQLVRIRLGRSKRGPLRAEEDLARDPRRRGPRMSELIG